MAWYDDLNNGFALGNQAQPGSIEALRATMSARQPAKKDTKKKKDFWTDQISTGGGIGGALAGAGAGAALGSVVPGIGTVIGGVAGGILGGALGSGGGELAENAITGDPLLQNVGQEALLGGVFSAPPLRAGKAILGAGKALATGAGKDVAKSVAENALTKPGLISQALGRAGQATSDLSNNLTIKQFRFTPSQLSNFKSKFGEDASKTIKKYGFTSAEDIMQKGVNPLQEQFTTNITSIPAITKDTLTKSLEAKIAPLLKSASSDNQALAKQLQKEATQLTKRFGETIDATELNTIRREFDSLVNYTQKTANPARYDVNKRIADALRETLQKSDPTGTLKNIGLEISKLKQLSDAAVKQAELGKGSLPAGLTSMLGASAGGGVGGPLGAIGGFAATKAINSNAGRQATSRGADSLSEALINAGQKQANPMSFGGVAGRLGTVGFIGGLNDQSSMMQSATNTNPASAQSNSSIMGQDYNNGADMSSQYLGSELYQPQTQQSQSTQSQSPYGRDNLLYDIQRDPKNADEYIAYYQQVQEVFGPSQQEALSQSNQSALASADNADNTLSQLEQLYSSAGGGSGRILGAIQNVAGSAGFDNNASVYNSLAQASVTQIAKALAGSGAGTVSDADARVIIAALPTLQDSPQEAQAKFSALKQRLQAARQNTLYYGQGGTGETDLQSALLNAQGGF